MKSLKQKIILREATEADRNFILSLSSTLAEVANLNWHCDETVLKFQTNYIEEMLEQSDIRKTTLIAENNEKQLGFIQAREHKDEISLETCCLVPLLAVTKEAQGAGVGKMLMKAAQIWAKEQGYRLLHLEVFSANTSAQEFYQHLGLEPESIVMVKKL